MANGSKVSDTVKTAVITVLASSTLFYMLGTMKNDDADLHISSETYKYSPEVTNIFTDTALPADDTAPITEDDVADRFLQDDGSSEDTQDVSYIEEVSETAVSDLPITVVTGTADTQIPPKSDTLPVTGKDNEELSVFWVENGEVWHVTDKCSSLSRSKKILSGTVDEAMTAGKTRVCKRCGD